MSNIELNVRLKKKKGRYYLYYFDWLSKYTIHYKVNEKHSIGRGYDKNRGIQKWWEVNPLTRPKSRVLNKTWSKIGKLGTK